MDEIERQMNQVKWSYAESDPDALAELKRRIEDTGRRGGWITYSELASEVVFHLPNVNKGQPFKINTDAWTPLDRDIIGEFLGYISTLSYRKGKFMASALVVRKDRENRKPSEHFLNG